MPVVLLTERPAQRDVLYTWRITWHRFAGQLESIMAMIPESEQGLLANVSKNSTWNSFPLSKISWN